MKRFFIFSLAALCSTYTIADDDYISQTSDQIFETPLSKEDILKKAEICLYKLIKNDAVMLVGTSSGFDGIFGVGKRVEVTSNIPAGDVLRLRNNDEGIILANSRMDIKANLIEYSIQSTINFAAKDQKFKISQQDIMYLQKDVGYGTPDSYKKLPAKDKWGSSLNKNTLAALEQTSQRIAECIKVPLTGNNW